MTDIIERLKNHRFILAMDARALQRNWDSGESIIVFGRDAALSELRSAEAVLKSFDRHFPEAVPK